MNDHDDIEWLSATWEIRGASLLTVVAGLLRASVGFQLLFIVRLVGDWWWIPYPMLALGALAFIVGAVSGRGRLWASWASLLSVGVLLLGGLAWEIFAVTHGLMSLLSVLAVLAALPAAALALLAIPPARRVHEARRKLLE